MYGQKKSLIGRGYHLSFQNDFSFDLTCQDLSEILITVIITDNGDAHRSVTKSVTDLFRRSWNVGSKEESDLQSRWYSLPLKIVFHMGQSVWGVNSAFIPIEPGVVGEAVFHIVLRRVKHLPPQPCWAQSVSKPAINVAHREFWHVCPNKESQGKQIQSLLPMTLCFRPYMTEFVKKVIYSFHYRRRYRTRS